MNAKASVTLCLTCVALSATLCAGPVASRCQAAAPHAALGLAAAAAAGQFGGSSGAQRASDDLLREARGAIKRGDYDKAEKLIADAEKLGIKYNALTERKSTLQTLAKVMSP